MTAIFKAVTLGLLLTPAIYANPLHHQYQAALSPGMEVEGDDVSSHKLEKCSKSVAVNATSPNSAAYDVIMQKVMDRQVQKYSFPGISVSYHLGKRCVAGILGSGSNAGTKLTGREPSRMASMTKVYTSSCVLRLWEEQHLSLNDTIHQYLDPNISTLLTSASYDTKNITIEQLLYHVSGIPDSNTDAYRAKILANPQHRWTRQEQVQFAIDHAPKDGYPGEKYSYSDTGYVLLGDIIENMSHLSQVSAYHQLLEFERLGLYHTWFETLEPTPADLPPRAHQFYGGIDAYTLDPSFDLYGGGGLDSTTEDEVTFLRALLHGHVFQHNKTLNKMQTIPETNMQSQYAMGIEAYTTRGQVCWGHTGFWGEAFYHCPRGDVTIATDQHQAQFPPNFDALELLDTALYMSSLDFESARPA